MDVKANIKNRLPSRHVTEGPEPELHGSNRHPPRDVATSVAVEL